MTQAEGRKLLLLQRDISRENSFFESKNIGSAALIQALNMQNI